jgi:excisionase family DNA binding protein
VTPRRDLLTPAQLCEWLGVSMKTVYGWTSRREIPFIKLGRLLRFDREVIEAWLAAKKVPVFDVESLMPVVRERHQEE